MYIYIYQYNIIKEEYNNLWSSKLQSADHIVKRIKPSLANQNGIVRENKKVSESHSEVPRRPAVVYLSGRARPDRRSIHG
jgi:hypothetical protein